jgi:hypothetical protein
MTGSPAFSAAAQNQFAVPSVSQGIVCALLKLTRTPSIPCCSFHFESRSADLGSCSGTRTLYGDRYAEFLDRVQAYAYFPYVVDQTQPNSV